MLIPDTVLLAVLLARSVAVSVTDWFAAEADSTESAGHDPAMPVWSSPQVQWTVTALLYQPLPFGGVVGAPVIVGLMLSTLTATDRCGSALPATSTLQ